MSPIYEKFIAWFERFRKRDSTTCASIYESETYEAGYKQAIHDIMRMSQFDNDTKIYLVEESDLEDLTMDARPSFAPPGGSQRV